MKKLIEPADWIEEYSDDFETFDDILYGAIKYENVRHNYAPKHLSRRDLRKLERKRWLEEFDTQLAIGGIVAAGLVVFLMAVGLFAWVVTR